MALFVDWTENAQSILNDIDARPWMGSGNKSLPNPELRRKTQQYSSCNALFLFKTRCFVEYSAHSHSEDNFIPSVIMNKVVQPLMEIQHVDKLCGSMFSLSNLHLLINEYMPGQGIMPHTDSSLVFGEWVAILSLSADCIMKFTQNEDNEVRSAEKEIEFYLPKNSLLILSGEARHNYKHSISKDLDENGYDYINCKKVRVHRERRVSLTFRTVLQFPLLDQ